MALLRPLFFNAIDYSPEEMAYSDEIELGKITLNGVGGVALDGNHNLASNFASPVLPDDLANKAYVDAVASGLDPHAAVVVKTDKGLGTQAILAGSGGTFAPMNNETMQVKLHSAATWTTVTFTNEATIGAALATILSALGTGTAAINVDQIDLKDTYFGKNSKVQTQNVAANITTKLGIANNGNVSGTGFTAAGAGPGKTLEAPTDAVGYNTIDGQLLTSSQRVLVANEAGVDTIADVDNGVYTVTTLGNGAGAKFKLTRATDADQHAPNVTELHQGMYVFVTNGSLGANTSWDVTTADPITVDAPSATPILFSQFSAAAQYTFDQGLKRILSSVQVDLDTAANPQGTGAAGGSSGLEFDADTALGKLRVAVMPNGGLERESGGVQIKLADTTLQLDGSGGGISVKGLPALFEIDTTPVGATVTAANLDTLTDGDNADALHTHAAATATEAPLVDPFMKAAAALTKGDPVYMSTTADRVGKGNTDTEVHAAILGMAVASQGSIGGNVQVACAGLAPGMITGMGFVAGDRIYLAVGGGLANAAPTGPGSGAQKVIEVGFAKNATDLFIRIIDRGKKAA
jgi:hypothetical protein